MNKIYKAKLGCDNCGHIDFYDVPVRAIIEDYQRETDRPSVYFHRNEEHYLLCMTCQLPRLKVFWFDESAVPVEAVSNE